MVRRKNKKGRKSKDPCSTTNNTVQQSESDFEKSPSASDTLTDISSNVEVDTPRNESGASTPTSIDIKISVSKKLSKMRKLEEETPSTDDTESTSTAQTPLNQTDSEEERDWSSSKCTTKTSNYDRERSERNRDKTRDNGRQTYRKSESHDREKNYNTRRNSQSPRKRSPSTNEGGSDRNKSYTSRERTNWRKKDESFGDKRSKSNDRKFRNKSSDRYGSNKSNNHSNSNKSNYNNYSNKSTDPNYNNKKNDRYDSNSRFERRRSCDGRHDSQFLNFERTCMTHEDNMDFSIVTEVFGDLFSASPEYSLGHCVAEDMNMGSGIAVQFRQTFKKISELLDQRQKQGQVAVLEDKSRYIYYLVTKRVSNGKPTYYTLWSSLQRMKAHIQSNKVVKLALPRIGCGLDGLEWKRVKRMLEYVFQDVNIEIKIYNYQQNHGKTKRKLQTKNIPKQDNKTKTLKSKSAK